MFSTSFALLAGTIALIQVVFLPGWLILKLFKFEFPMINGLIYSFGISLMTNYWLIFILAAAKLYTFKALAVIIIIEILLALFVYRNKLSSIWNYSVNDAFIFFKNVLLRNTSSALEWITEQFGDLEKTEALKINQQQVVRKNDSDDMHADRNHFNNSNRINSRNYFNSFYMFAFLSIAILTMGYLIYIFISNIGTVFNLWDPIISWNRWAVEFSQNGLPLKTWEYPQLITSNWSISYTLIGMPIEFFSKIIMPLFPLCMATLMFYIGIKRKSLGYISAVPFTILLMRILNGSAIMATEGYVDTAVTFFFFIAIILLLNTKPEDTDQDKISNIIIGSIFAVGAAMTKQGGLYITALYLLLAWLLVIKDSPAMKARFNFKSLFMYVIFALVLLGPFYISKELAINSQSDASVLPFITNQIYGNGISHAEQMLNAFIYIIKKCYGLVILYVFLLIFALKNKKYRNITLLVLIPYSLIWSAFFSYDTRNLSAGMPILGLLAGLGLENMLSSGNKFINAIIEMKLKMKVVWVFMILFIAFIAVNPFISKKIVSQYNAEKRQIYDTELSTLISNYLDNNPDGKLYTNFGILYFLPATENRIYSEYDGYTSGVNEFYNFDIVSRRNDINYIFAADYTESEIVKKIEQGISDGRFALIFRRDKSTLVKINHK